MMDLTEREQEIYNLICEKGLWKKEIAKKLVLSKTTIETHLNNIYLKCDVHDRATLIYRYWKDKNNE